MNRKDLDPAASVAAAFGQRLRGLRDERGWTQDELGRRMGCTGTHVSAVETGRRPPTKRFAASADRALGTGDRLARQSRSVRESAILEGFPEYVSHEMHASEIRLFELGIIPGLLQTAPYAAAITAGAVQRGAITERQAEERTSLLARRRDSLNREPAPLVHIVLDESCLRRVVGGHDVMGQQMRHLLDFAGRPHSIVQVAPYTLGERRSFDLPVYLLTLPDRAVVSYAESAQEGRLEREFKVVQPLLTAYHQLQAECLSQAASVAMIREVLEE